MISFLEEDTTPLTPLNKSPHPDSLARRKVSPVSSLGLRLAATVCAIHPLMNGAVHCGADVLQVLPVQIYIFSLNTQVCVCTVVHSLYRPSQLLPSTQNVAK